VGKEREAMLTDSITLLRPVARDDLAVGRASGCHHEGEGYKEREETAACK
jgi:hypothetical protein